MRIIKPGPGLPLISRGRPIQITVNGRVVQAYEGELVSTVLLAEGISTFARKHATGKPSGIYCGMGVCYECLVTVDGVPNTRACQTYAADRMAIETSGKGEPWTAS